MSEYQWRGISTLRTVALKLVYPEFFDMSLLYSFSFDMHYT